MSKFRIRHATRYLYEDTVRDSANQIMLYPIQDEYQEVLQQVISISGNPLINIFDDCYGNKVGTFTHSQPHRELLIHSQLSVVTLPIRFPEDNVPFDLQWNEMKGFAHQLGLIDFIKPERFSGEEEAKKIVESERGATSTPFQAAKLFCQYVYDNFEYKKGITTVESTLDEIWKLKSGVCQDFAHILLMMLRQVGIPSRYVSGYICPNRSGSGMRGEGATHAWAEAYLPFYGWVGLDPTNNCIVNETHIRLAVGKNFSDCSPVKGTYRGTSNHTLEVTVTVAYEDGTMPVDAQSEVDPEPVVTSVYRNSFRKFQEMQQQQ